MANREWEMMKDQRRAEMARLGFPEGARVRARIDGHPAIPAPFRFGAGDEGVVILNMMAEPGDVSVVWSSMASNIPHAVKPENLEVLHPLMPSRER
jgi:hypothetical protein